MIWSDLYADGGNQPLTKLQYANMKKWKEGNFTNDWLRRRRPSSQVTPQGLDRAALETCAGAACTPGSSELASEGSLRLPGAISTRPSGA